MSRLDSALPPPVAPSFDRDTLISCANGEGVVANLEDPTLHLGWQNAVLETADGWILRFPLKDRHDFLREIRILDVLGGRLPAKIPVVEWTGAKTRMAAYRMLKGSTLGSGGYLAASEAKKQRISESMAGFLVRMHTSLSPGEIAECNIAPLTSAHLIDEVDKRSHLIHSEYRDRIFRVGEKFRARWVAGEPVETKVLHNDFHLGNMVFIESTGSLEAVWDFSCVELGDPSYDLRYLFEDSYPLALSVARCYERETGIELDVEGAMLAGFFEALSDALVEGRDVGAVYQKWSFLPGDVSE